jgi:protein-S-isoprenylcysteine O-methyltransferase Ste14
MMTVSKLVWLAFALCWGVIRYRYARRARRSPHIEEQDRSYENLLLTLTFAGYGGIPALYLATSWLSFGDYPFQPILFCAGVAASIGALWLFWRSHADLGRNFSIKLAIREKQSLVTTGVYRLIRHPMYASFLLWSLGQVLLLPNWITGLAAIFSFCILYFGRIRREEKLMLEKFGADYREYMMRTKRLVPYVY